ncbi:MAG: ABC transporter permease, partial [Anaerolineales bacterium]
YGHRSAGEPGSQRRSGGAGGQAWQGHTGRGIPNADGGGEMKDDILTVMWKERKGLFRAQGRRSQALLTMLSPLFLAIYLPYSAGVDWVDRSMSLLLAAVVPFILVGITVPDSFAGERERHTLATLLASRLPDRAILFGKLVMSVLFGWGITLLILLVSLVALNVLHWPGYVLFYKPSLLFADLAVSFLVALFTAGLGVFFSLRSSTVQQAQQLTMSVLLLPAMVLQFGVLFILQSPSLRDTLKSTLGALSFAQLMLIIVAVLGTVATALLWVAMARFNRARLILSQ